MSGYVKAMQRYFEWTGRSPRAEYWYYVLVVVILSLVAGLIDSVIGIGGGMQGVGIIGAIVSLVHFIPGITVGIRRLHDIDRTGWWLLIALVPLVGFIVLLIFFVTPGTEEPNRFGPPEPL